MTGHADPQETRQILLPFILGAREAGGHHAVTQVLDPTGRSSTAWGYDGETGSYVTTIDRGVDAALVADPRGSGLFFPLVLSRTGGASPVFTDRPVPLREAVWHVQTVVARSGLRILSSKRAYWRDEPATPAQYDLLFRLAPDAHKTACEERWDRGTMSLRLTVELNRARIKTLQQQAASSGRDP